MIWSKTDAGRQEMQARAVVKERSQRTLLLLIDGAKTDETLLSSVAGLKPEDFGVLASLGLIEPVAGASGRTAAAPAAAAPTAAPASAPAQDERFLDYGKFTAALTKLISSELGLRGFTLTLAVEKAGTIQELRDVAERALDQIRERKGDAVADKARHALFGE